jgi:MSHA pilin protein MshD
MKSLLTTHRRRQAFSIMETTMATLMVGILLAGSLASFARIRGMQQDMVMMEQANLLAIDLMNEILSLPYSEPGVTTVSTGPESGESSRSLYDDVDDYNGLTETSAVTRSGSAIAGASRYRRRVSVFFVQPTNPSIISVTIRVRELLLSMWMLMANRS